MAWEVNNKVAPSATSNLMVAEVICIAAIGDAYTENAPPNTITIEKPAAISSSSGVADGSSSSGVADGSSSSGGSSSSDDGNAPIMISYNVQGNMLSAMQNAVNLQSTSKAMVQIFDLKGNAVRTLKFSQGSYLVPLSGLPKGLYIVKASNASWKQTIKVTVK
jgi:hypothetical protein